MKEVEPMENNVGVEMAVIGHLLTAVYLDFRRYMCIETTVFGEGVMMIYRFAFTNEKLPESIYKLIPNELKYLLEKEGKVVVFDNVFINISMPFMSGKVSKVDGPILKPYYNIVDPKIDDSINLGAMMPSEVKIVNKPPDSILVTIPDHLMETAPTLSKDMAMCGMMVSNKDLTKGKKPNNQPKHQRRFKNGKQQR